jgi:hypothetical protein
MDAMSANPWVMSPGGGIPSSLLSIDMECDFTEGFPLMRLVGS